VVPLDIRQWVEFYPTAASARMLSRLVAEQRMTERRAAGDQDLMVRLTAAEPRERMVLSQEFLRTQVSRVLRIPADKLNMNVPLTSLGMDSLMGLELRNRMVATLGVPLPLTLLWTYPTMRALSELLVGQVTGTKGRSEADERVSDVEVVKPMDVESAVLDEDGLLTLLKEELALRKARE
jgi:acyl carrier protein